MISVIIPCYKQAEFLAEAIQSVLEQDYPAKEIIVINDGSPDHTDEVAALFANRIRYIKQPNGGPASARNAGLKVANGEYIAFLDADDVSLPGRLSLQASILDSRPEVGLVATDAYIIDRSGQVLGVKSTTSGVPSHPEDFRWETVSYCPTTSTVMVRRACLEEIGGFDESTEPAGEDWLAWVRLSLVCRMVYVHKPTIYYRVHEKNLTRFMESINAGNRIACRRAVEWERFCLYPSHFRARLLFYRFATAWRVEPKAVAFRYFLCAVATDPTQLPYGLKVIRQGIINAIRRYRQRA